MRCEKEFHALLDHEDRTTFKDLETEDDIGVEYFNEVASTPAGYDDMRLDDRPAVDEDELHDKYSYLNLSSCSMLAYEKRHGRVVKRSRGHDEEPFGCTHSNPFMTLAIRS